MAADSNLEPGTFVLVSPPRGKLGGLFSSLRNEPGERVKALLRSSSAEPEGRHLTKQQSASGVLAAPGPLVAGAVNDSPAFYSLAAGAGLVVRFGLREVAGLGLHHLAPNVHYDPATRTACVFSGHLQNLDELADRYSPEWSGEGPTSPSSVLAARADPRQLAADTLLRMYHKERGGDLLVLLSELQGQFAFVLYDGERRQVFAARDSSGSEPLYYELDEDGALSLSNAQPAVPSSTEPDDGQVQWSELPPGHFISGRTPKLQQFALTPQQLSIRESYERSMDEEMTPTAFAALARDQAHEMRRSLSPDRSGRGGDAFYVY